MAGTCKIEVTPLAPTGPRHDPTARTRTPPPPLDQDSRPGLHPARPGGPLLLPLRSRGPHRPRGREVYCPYLARPEAVQAGQLALTAVSAEEPGHKPLARCKMVPVVLTLYAGQEDYEYRRAHGPDGVAALRRRQIARMAEEALDQGALLTAEDLAFRIFNCGLRTISRALRALAERGIVVPLRSQQKDAGRALSHRREAAPGSTSSATASPRSARASTTRSPPSPTTSSPSPWW